MRSQPVSDPSMGALQTADEERASAAHDAHRLRDGLLSTLALGLLLLGAAIAVPDLREVLGRASDAAGGWLVLAVALEVASCLGYVALVRLVLPRYPRRPVRWLAWSEMAFGAVVPAGGAGGLAVGAWAMRAWGAPWSRIANRTAVIFLLTSALNAAVLALAGIGAAFGIETSRGGIVYGLVPAGIAIIGVGLFLCVPWASARWRRLAPLARWVIDTRNVALAPDWRLLGAAGYLLFDIAVLWACLRAIGSAPPLLALVLGYQIGYLANLIPIPGGVGVLEGGLLAALMLYGLPLAPTAAAVVLYHAIALSVPTLGGSYGFVRLRKSATAASAEVTALPQPATRAAEPRQLAA